MLSITDFQKVELVVGKVTEAFPHPNADKLLVLKADLGEEEPRTLVAGLKGYYEPEELVGKSIVVVANLEPVKLRGIESRGMLLAAQDGENIVLLTLDRDVTPGAKIR